MMAHWSTLPRCSPRLRHSSTPASSCPAAARRSIQQDGPCLDASSPQRPQQPCTQLHCRSPTRSPRIRFPPSCPSRSALAPLARPRSLQQRRTPAPTHSPSRPRCWRRWSSLPRCSPRLRRSSTPASSCPAAALRSSQPDDPSLDASSLRRPQQPCKQLHYRSPTRSPRTRFPPSCPSRSALAPLARTHSSH